MSVDLNLNSNNLTSLNYLDNIDFDLANLDELLPHNFIDLMWQDLSRIENEQLSIHESEDACLQVKSETSAKVTNRSSKDIPSAQKIGTKRVNLSRERLKMELVELRNQVQVLEQQVKELESETAQTYSTSSDGPPSLCTLWKNLAMSQREARRKSTIENEKLHLIVAKQMKLAKSIQKILDKQPQLKGTFSN